jgi:hypothetical protein
MRFRDAARGVLALGLAGCNYQLSPPVATGPAGPTPPRIVAPSTVPYEMGGLTAAGTQDGLYPLGPSTRQVGRHPYPTGRSGLSLNGTVPSWLVRSGTQQPQAREQEQTTTQVRARMGGDVAYIPGVPDRRGSGISARNGTAGRSWGSAYVQTPDFTDPETSGAQAVGAATAVGGGARPMGVGGAGRAGQSSATPAGPGRSAGSEQDVSQPGGAQRARQQGQGGAGRADTLPQQGGQRGP